MSELHQITLYVPGENPTTYDLDEFNSNVIRLGKGPYHSVDGTPAEQTPVNDIQINPRFKFVSRAHCTFHRDPHGIWYVTDDNSKNGTWFNNHLITQHRLSNDDKLYIGRDADMRLVITYSCIRQDTQTIGDGTLTSFSLRALQRCVIGRAENCDIVISHPMASRWHCVITQEQGQFFIEDNHSTNGVLLNSAALEGRKPLRAMDRISIAGTSFIFNGDSLFYRAQTGGVGIVVSHVCKRVGKGRQAKFIANDISLNIQPNTFVAIIGGSGAGKSTLLNCMSGLTDMTSGDVYINGESIRTGGENLRHLLGYVPQQDIVYDSLTLERMLLYSAKLRMPPDTSPQEIQKKIDETLETVELTEHRKTMISRLSGGQKKRASIAVELLASPKVFFLDEPSSGLDPGTEKHLMKMLKRLSQNGRTVVMVTHTVQNIDLCDTVVCMGQGGLLCYAGSPADTLKFFGQEHMTDVYDALNEESDAWSRRFRELSSTVAEPHRAPGKGGRSRGAATLAAHLRQFRVMTARYVEIMFNSRGRLIMLLLMPVALALLVCLAFGADGGIQESLYRMYAGWYEAGTHDANILRSLISSMADQMRGTFPFLVAGDTMAFLFAFSCAVFWTGIFNSVQEISKERPIYERERFSGVGVVPYVLSKFFLLAALCLLQSAIMTAVLLRMSNTSLVYPAMEDNLEGAFMHMIIMSRGVVLGDGLYWLETFLTTCLCSLSAMCLGLVISTLASNDMALVLCPICLMPQILFSDVVVEVAGITKVISNFISCKWSCVAYMVSARINEMYKSISLAEEGVGYVTDPKNLQEALNAAETGKVYRALKFIYDPSESYLFGQNGVASAWIALGLMCVVCVAAAMLILRFRRRQSR